jgi:DNA topoisomerase III
MPTAAERKGKERAIATTKRKRQTKLEKGSRQKPAAAAIHSGSDSRVEGALREWRMSEARRRRLPAFRIFSDKTLGAIARQRPRTAHELLAISGIGIATVEKYGQQIYLLVNDDSR